MTLAIVSQVLPDGEFGSAYSATLTATGSAAATPVFTWSISSGSLPPGLTLNASTGVISGTPTNPTNSSVTSKNYSVTVQVADNAGATALDYYVITIYISRQAPEGPFSETFWGGYWAPPPGLDPGISDITTQVDFKASALDHESVELEWTRATEDKYDSVVIVRNTKGYPKIISEGEIVFIGRPADKVDRITDSNLSAGNYYYYSLFFREIATTPKWVRVARVYALVPFNYQSGEWMFRLLPEWYQELDAQTPGHPDDEKMARWGHLRRFMELLGTQYDAFRTEIDSILNAYDAKRVRVDLLEYFSAMYGFPYETQIGERQLRMLMDNWFYILKRKGTLPAAEMFVTSLTGYSNKIHLGRVEGKPNLLQSTDDSEARTSVGQWKVFDTYADLPGGTGNYLTTFTDSPVHSNLGAPSTTGELDVRVRITSNQWSFTGNQRTIISKFSNTTGNRSWKMSLGPAGNIYFLASVDGGSVNIYESASSAAINLTNGETKWLRVRFVSNSGGTALIRYFTSDDGTTWTKIGDDVVYGTSWVPYNATTEPLRLGFGSGSGFSSFVGKIHEFAVYKKVDSTSSADLIAGTNFDGIQDKDNFVDDASNRWTALGTSFVAAVQATSTTNFGAIARVELNTATPTYYSADVPNALLYTGGYGSSPVFDGDISSAVGVTENGVGVSIDPTKTYRYQAGFRAKTSGFTGTPTLLVNWYSKPKKVTDTASCVQNSAYVTGAPYVSPGSQVILIGAGENGADLRTTVWEVATQYDDATPQNVTYKWTLTNTAKSVPPQKSFTGNLVVFRPASSLGESKATGTAVSTSAWTNSSWVIAPSDIPDDADLAIPGFMFTGAKDKEVYASAFFFRENSVTNTLVYEPARLLYIEMYPQRANYFPNPGFEGAGTYDGYARTTGVSGTGISMPSTTNNAITGDIDIRVKVAMDDWTPSASGVFLCKSIPALSQGGYFFGIDTAGKLTFFSSSGGLTYNVSKTSSVATGFADDTTHWVRVTFDVDDGAGNNVVKFYTSDDGSTWTQLGSTFTTSGATSIFNNTAAVQMGSQGLTFQNYLTKAKFYYSEIRNSIDGTVATYTDFTNNPFKTSGGNAVTYNGVATPVASDGLYFPATTTTYFQRSADSANPITGGSYSMKVFLAGTASSNDAYIWSAESYSGGTITVPDCTNGDVYSFSVTVKPAHDPVGDTVTPVFLKYYDNGTTEIVESSERYLISGDWTQVKYELPVANNMQAKFKFGLLFRGAPANAVYYLDAVELGCNEYLHQYSYFDGNIDPTSKDFEWSGSANASVSMYYPNRATREARLKALLPDYLPPNAAYELDYNLHA